MIDNITITFLIISVTFCTATLIATLMGATLMGQHSVWRFLRKRGEVIKAGWKYTAVKVNSDGTVVKKWD